MKTLFKLSLIVLFTLSLSNSYAYFSAEKERTIKKEFDVNSDASLTVKNKYGDIICSVWDKNVVSIEVNISVETSNEKKAQSVIDQIEIEFDGNSNSVNAETKFLSRWENNNGNLDLEINYTIYMPSTLSVSLFNKFGSIYLEEVSGPADLVIYHGVLSAKKLMNEKNSIDINFSGGEFGYIEKAEVEIKHSSLEVEEASELKLNSKHSGINIGRVDYANIDSQYDGLSLNDVSVAEIEGKFSEITIDKLSKSMNLSNEYGSAKIKYVKPGFESIEVHNEFAGVVIAIDEEASYSVEAEMELGNLSYPERNSNISKEVHGYTNFSYKGTVGSDSNPASKIIIESENSGVTLKSW